MTDKRSSIQHKTKINRRRGADKAARLRRLKASIEAAPPLRRAG